MTVEQLNENGYIIARYNESGYILTRKRGIMSNYFFFIDGSPRFESMLYVNKTTLKIISKFFGKRRKLMEKGKRDCINQ